MFKFAIVNNPDREPGLSGLMKILCRLSAVLLAAIWYAVPAEAGDIPARGDIALYNIYKDARDAGQHAKAASAAEQFIAGTDSSAATAEIADMYSFLAQYCCDEEYRYSEAIRWFDRAMTCYGALGDSRNRAWAAFELGKLRYKTGRYDKALSNILDAEEGFRQCGDSKGIAECYNILGAIYYICRNYSKSNQYAERFEQCARALGDTMLMALSLNNSAVYANRIGDTLKSFTLISESIALCRATKDTSLLCSMYLNISASFLNNGNLDSAGKYIALAEPIVRKIPERGSYHYLNGVLELMRGDDVKAREQLLQAVDAYSRGEFVIERRKCHSLLENIYRSRGDSLRAYDELRKYYEIDSRLEKENVFIELFDYQNEIIRQKEAEKATVKKNSMILYSVVICFTVIITVILLFLLHRTKARNKAEMRAQKEILEMKKMQEYSMNRLTEEVISMISSIAKETDEPETRQKLNRISVELSGSKDPGQWKEVSQYIPEFNSDFYQRLIRDFPDLTTNERRLCTLLNLNMSTKEIAQMTRQTPHSIKIARCRLRAKLNLTGSKMTLQEFLAQYNS